MDINMTPGGSSGLPDVYGPDHSMTLGPQHGLRCWPKPQASALPSVLAGVALGSTLDLANAVAKGDSADHSGRLVLAAAHPSDPNMARGSGPEARHSCGL